MIPLGQEQRLGRAAYLMMASQRMSAGLGILLLATGLLVAKGGLAVLISKPLALAGVTNASAAALSNLNYITAGLFIIALLVCLIGVLIARMQYAHYTFTFEEFDMKLTHGIIAIIQISIPYRSMQDINIERNLGHRLSGTSRVIINSAGHEESDERNETDIVLDPISEDRAEDIRLMLQRKIGVQVVQGEKEADRQADSLAEPKS